MCRQGAGLLDVGEVPVTTVLRYSVHAMYVHQVPRYPSILVSYTHLLSRYLTYLPSLPGTPGYFDLLVGLARLPRHQKLKQIATRRLESFSILLSFPLVLYLAFVPLRR